ncbi:unnamed protein product [Porites lobata]|uniref:Uncharacterized protein n=1 Tax=Porites lobata TaxID=104759 RepID=A0ABN8P8A7_9CNID|nr:unnamed protein product [Porites lobata]
MELRNLSNRNTLTISNITTVCVTPANLMISWVQPFFHEFHEMAVAYENKGFVLSAEHAEHINERHVDREKAPRANKFYGKFNLTATLGLLTRKTWEERDDFVIIESVSRRVTASILCTYLRWGRILVPIRGHMRVERFPFHCFVSISTKTLFIMPRSVAKTPLTIRLTSGRGRTASIKTTKRSIQELSTVRAFFIHALRCFQSILHPNVFIMPRSFARTQLKISVTSGRGRPAEVKITTLSRKLRPLQELSAISAFTQARLDIDFLQTSEINLLHHSSRSRRLCVDDTHKKRKGRPKKRIRNDPSQEIMDINFLQTSEINL